FVGLEGYEKRNIHTLSGGEAQRAVLGSFLTLDPSVIILDEAFSQLDPFGKKEIYQKLKNMVIKKEKILIIVDKAPYSNGLADSVLSLEDGKIVYNGLLQNETLFKTHDTDTQGKKSFIAI